MPVKSGKKGLGKGLDSLIPNLSEEENITKKTKTKEKEVKETTGGVTLLKIKDISPNKDQPRKTFNEDKLNELAESIKNHGIVQPLVVQKKDDYYEIIAGERRWRAAMIAKLKEVPVVIQNYTEQEIVEIALIENIQREDLNPIEEAQAYKRLLEEYNLKQDQVAERVAKSRTAVTNSMRLLKLSEEVQQMVIEELITSGHARALLAIEDPKLQNKIAIRVMDERLSVRETEKLVNSIKNPKPEKVKEEVPNAFIYEDIENKLKEIIGTKVKVNHKASGKGKIEIEYYSNKELERLVELFTEKQK